jgi:hypothetical protein
VQEIESFLSGRRIARVVEVHEDRIEIASFERGEDPRRGFRGLDLVLLALE